MVMKAVSDNRREMRRWSKNGNDEAKDILGICLCGRGTSGYPRNMSCGRGIFWIS